MGRRQLYNQYNDLRYMLAGTVEVGQLNIGQITQCTVELSSHVGLGRKLAHSRTLFISLAISIDMCDWENI